MHTTASSLVAIVQYFWRIHTSLLYGTQQIRIVAADSIWDSIQTEIYDSQVSKLCSTCRWVGFPLKNFVLSALWAGENFGLMKTQPCAIASSGAGPSYGKPSPTNS